MATAMGKAAQTTSVTRVSESASDLQFRVNRDGALITQDWIMALVAEGRVFGCQVGSGTTPVAMNTSYVAATQDLYLYIPSGTLVVPLYICIAFEDTGPAQVADVVAAYSSNGDAAVTGSTALTIYNYKTLASPDSSCVATPVVTSNGTTPLGGTDFLEFWRPYAGFTEDAFNSSTGWINKQVPGTSWSALDEVPPFVGTVGTDCAISIHAEPGSASIGYITLVWAELPASAFA